MYVQHMTVHDTYNTILNNIIWMTILLHQAMLHLLQNCDRMHNWAMPHLSWLDTGPWMNMAQGQSQDSRCEICGGQFGDGTVFISHHIVFPCQYSSTNATNSFIHSFILSTTTVDSTVEENTEKMMQCFLCPHSESAHKELFKESVFFYVTRPSWCVLLLTSATRVPALVSAHWPAATNSLIRPVK